METKLCLQIGDPNPGDDGLVNPSAASAALIPVCSNTLWIRALFALFRSGKDAVHTEKGQAEGQGAQDTAAVRALHTLFGGLFNWP